MAMGSQQLAEDFDQLKEFLELYPNIVLLKVEGQPPDNYEIEYALRGYSRDGENNITISSNHRIRVSLPFGYPHFAPIAKPLTPVFHPDFDPAAIRIADQWQKNPSLPELILHIGEMISGNIYNLEDPFNPEAADWYKNHTDQLPLDTLSLADIEETDVQLDSLVDDTFASLGLENDDFLEPEKEIDPAEIDYIRDLVAQNKIFTANKLLSDLPSNAQFPDREEIQQNIGKILRKTDQLFKLAEQLEDMSKFDEAVEVTDNLLALAADAPGIDALRERIQQSYQFSQSVDPTTKGEVNPERFSERQVATTPPPPPKKPRKKPSFRLATGIPLKPILIAMLLLGLSVGMISLYFKDQNTLSQSQANLLKAQLLLDKKQFDTAQDALESARRSLSDLTLLRFRKSTYEQGILSLLNSPELQEGLKGRILYEGEYISEDAAAALKELNVLTDQGQALAKQNRVNDALTLYRQAYQLALDHKLTKQEAPLKEVIQSLELQQTLSMAERAEQNKNWEQAAEAYRKALSLSANIQSLGTISDITHRLTAATFRHDFDQSKKAFTQSQWQETIRFLEQAQQTIGSNLTAVTDKERQDLHKLLINARLYLMLSTAREAYEAKNWEQAIEEYQKALHLLSTEPDSTEQLVGDSVDKIAKTLLMVQIAQIQEQLLVAEGNNDSRGVISQSKAIQRLIQSSKYADDPSVQAVYRKIGEKINNQQEILSQNERIVWLEENFERIFRNNYPTFRGSKLMQPKAVFNKKIGSKSVFTLTCVEKSQGSSSKLELNYMYDPATGSWSVPKE
jgi:flavin-binding protein dodecin/predicted DNA-binding antitoxin AbrB/MazE fold protein